MITFRIDDVGACSKHFNQHSKIDFAPFNVGISKMIWPFKGWARYNELTALEWEEFLKIFKEKGIIPIIAITACWAEKDNSLTPFFKKFPSEAEVLKKAFLKGEIIVANHGLCHCVLGKHLPRFFSSNRKYHREFWPYLSEEIHSKHVLESQKILEDYFGKNIEIFVPPGNVWSCKTYEALKKTNIKKVMANRYMADSEEQMIGIEFIDDRENCFCFHDRELKLYGKKWLIKKINELL